MTAAGRCIFCFYNMISGSKDQKVVRACTIRLLNLGPAKHEKVAIYAVNQRISNDQTLIIAFFGHLLSQIPHPTQSS